MAYNNKLCISSWVLLFITQILLPFTKTEAKVPAIIVFGDSSVDAGNNNFISTIAKSNFEPYGRDFTGGKPTGRFSNGRIATDFISQSFGLKPTIPAYLDPAYSISDFAVGVTFASAASGYDNATADVLSVIPPWKQLEYYKEYQNKLKAYIGEAKAREIIREALYMTSMGTNDFLENYYTMPIRSSQYSPEEYQNFLVRIATTFVRDLYGLGARKISVGGLPPMGCMPLERSTNIGSQYACVDSYNTVALQFNGKLNKMVVDMNKELSGAKIVFSNPYGMLMKLITKPSAFGFQVTGAGCCATGFFEMGYACSRTSMFTCTDANKYVFWDAFHPSEKTNHIIANNLMKHVLSQFR